jgi:redox-sensitive bicupin YhaK (pirin superfamily)
VLEPGSFELLTAREETRHKLMGMSKDSETRWMSVVVRCPPLPGGPARRFQVVTTLSSIPVGDAAVVRFLVGEDAPAASGAGLECADVEFRAKGRCVCPVGAGRRVVAYAYRDSATIEGQPIDEGMGALIENATELSLEANAGTRVLLASAPRMML